MACLRRRPPASSNAAQRRRNGCASARWPTWLNVSTRQISVLPDCLSSAAWSACIQSLNGSIRPVTTHVKRRTPVVPRCGASAEAAELPLAEPHWSKVKCSGVFLSASAAASVGGVFQAPPESGLLLGCGLQLHLGANLVERFFADSRHTPQLVNRAERPVFLTIADDGRGLGRPDAVDLFQRGGIRRVDVYRLCGDGHQWKQQKQGKPGFAQQGVHGFLLLLRFMRTAFSVRCAVSRIGKEWGNGDFRQTGKSSAFTGSQAKPLFLLPVS